MTQFDTIFSESAKSAVINWCIVDSLTEQAQQTLKVKKYPCIWRNSTEEKTTPLFDNLDRVQKRMSLYFVELGFNKVTQESRNENMEALLERFLVFRDKMKRSGIEVELDGDPFPNWRQTNLEDYGIVFNITCKYKLCPTI